ncbi:MAG: carbohydrate-binding protein [Spirochaetales bacterium]|nr:carbohydrate-binding protein [Spirochaetales bacterium]
MKQRTTMGVVMAICVFSMGFPLTAQQLGDANNDSKIDIVDGLLAAQVYVGLTPKIFFPDAADVNGDTRVTIVDALLIAQFYVGLIDVFPGALTATPQPLNHYSLEAEDAYFNDGWIETQYPGFSGSAYVNTANALGTYVEWALEASESGQADLSIIYANGGGDNRPMEMSLNGRALSGSLDFPATSAWENWTLLNTSLTLTSGVNTLRLTSLSGSGAPNLDKVEIAFKGMISIPQPTAPPVLPELTVYIAGDSTVQDYPDSSIHQAGWGQMLPSLFGSKAVISNRAIGGRTARRFIDEGRLDDIFSVFKPGDYLLVQFGTNDSHKTATYTINGQTIPYYLDPQTDFKFYLQKYIDGVRSRNGNIILVTPPPRNSAYCTGGNGMAAHAQAMKELGATQKVPVVDLNQMTVNYLIKICPAPVPENFFLLRADGTVDGTHFQENGARIMAGFITNALQSQNLPLALYLK